MIFETPFSLEDPLVLAALGVAAIVLLIVILLIVTLLRAGRSARNGEEITRQMGGLGQAVQMLGQGQDQLTGGLRTVSDAQANAQTQTVQLMEARLAEVQRQMQERLHENALRSARALTDMQERMNETLKGSAVKTTVEVLDVGLQVLLVFVPAHPINADRCLLFEFVKTLVQQFFIEMVKERCELELAALAGRFAHTPQSA